MERTDDEVTGRVALEYDVNENVLAYASVSRGFKSGGFNGSGLEPPFEPEYLLAYEVGSKAILGDGRVQLNVAGFYYDYTDVQVQRIVNVGSSIDNAGEASGIGAVFGRNLGDKFFTESRFEIAESLGTVLSVVGPPREWGIEMGLLF